MLYGFGESPLPIKMLTWASSSAGCSAKYLPRPIRAFYSTPSSLRNLNKVELSNHLQTLSQSRNNEKHVFQSLAQEITHRCQTLEELPNLCLVASTFSQANLHPEMFSHLSRVAVEHATLAPQTRLEMISFCHSLAIANVFHDVDVDSYVNTMKPKTEPNELNQLDFDGRHRRGAGFAFKGELGRNEYAYRFSLEEDPLRLHSVMLAWKCGKQSVPPMLAMLSTPDWFAGLDVVHSLQEFISPQPLVRSLLHVIRSLGFNECQESFTSELGLSCDGLVRPGVGFLLLQPEDYLSDGVTPIGSVQLRIRLLRAEGISTCLINAREFASLSTEKDKRLLVYPQLFPPEIPFQEAVLQKPLVLTSKLKEPRAFAQYTPY